MHLKAKLQNFIFPLGSRQQIRLGYLKGYKIRLSENSLWSPIIGGWEPTMQKIMVNVLRNGDIAYDLGANNGLHGLLMASLVGNSGLVYNFEPFIENVNEINENFQLNGLTNFENIIAAISNYDGIAQFEIASHHKQGKLHNPNDNANVVGVEVRSLDSLIEQGLRLPNFMKIDIEGAEGNALNGFAKNIEKCFPEMIIELHNPEQDLEVGKFLKFYNYKAYKFDPFKKLTFTEVSDYLKPYPQIDGIWGTVFCIGPTKDINQFKFNR